MTLDFFILIFCSTAMSLMGLLILLRNPRAKINQIFALLALSIISWTIFNYLSQVFPTSNIATRLVFLAGISTASSLIAFLNNFPDQVTFLKKLPVRLQYLGSLVLLPTVFTTAFISRVTEDEIVTSYLYPVFVGYILYSLVLLVFLLAKQGKQAKNASQKMQIKFIAWGVILYALTAVISNVLLPLYVKDWSSSRLGPVFSLILIGAVSYSIIKHKLFDIRLIVARALGYALTLITTASLYSLFVFVILAKILDEETLSGSQGATYLILAILFGFSLPPLKTFFDRLTNKLFYKDAYDAQLFLNNFNKTLVGNIDLQPLLRQAAELIESTLKAEFCLFDINKTENSSQRIIGSRGGEVTKDITPALNDIAGIHNKLTIVDELGEKDGKLKAVLSNYDISVVCRLTSSSNQKQGQGYLIMGRKKSGNLYNKQDVQVLEIVVNELVIAIQNAMRFEEIQAFTVTLQEKVDEATRQLRRTNEKLKALDETKDEFISMASHQLRTPLTSVKGYVSMVMEGDAGKITKQQHELLGQAFASSQRMVYLIADLLNVSRLRTGKFVIENKPTQLADVIESEIEQLKEAAQGKQQELTFVKPKSFPELMLDETKIRQVIMNFTDNALYYTPSGGHIRLSLEDKGQTVQFTVADDGIGVPKEEQHRMFTKFYRAGNARKARPDGTGLGIFMAKKVIVAQGGAVIFQSEEGKGSTFGFSFSKSKLKVPAKAKVPKASDALAL